MGMRTAIVCSLLMAAGVPAAVAHPGGHGDQQQRPVISEATAKQIAEAAVANSAAAEQVEGSWKFGEIQGLERVYLRGEMQWLATFQNTAAKGEKELFVVVTTDGEVVARALTLGEGAAKARAREELTRLKRSGGVPSSWRDADPTKIEKRPDGSHWRWVATVDDAAQPEQKQVFIFMLPYGEFLAANFSGK